MFTKHVTLLLKTATTKSCLNKLCNHYFVKVMKPKIISSDHGSQFTSTKSKETISALGIEIKFSPIRHPESNPTERVMRELGKYFRIYCNETHKKRPELIPYIEKWMNSSVNSATGYTPIELLGGDNKLKLFETFKLPEEEDLPTKLLKVYTRMKSRSEKKMKAKKEGKFERKLKIGDSVCFSSCSN
jgi:transposase InsO family protein